MVGVSPKSAIQPNEMTLTISNYCCRLMRDWKLESLRNGKEISAVLLRTEKRGLPVEVVYNFQSDFPQTFPFHFTFNKIFRLFCLMVSTLIFRKIYSKILNYLFLLRSERCKSTFQSLICRKQLQMVSAISFDWFPDFGKKTFTIIHRSSQTVYSEKQ